MATSSRVSGSYAITKEVRDRGPISRAEIARCLNMSPSTVGRLVDHLFEMDILREIGLRSGIGAGRPSRLLQFNPDFSSVLTVDLRLTDAYAALTNLSGDILTTRTRQLSVRDEKRSLNELIELIQGFIELSDYAPPIEVIVIGAPSIVNVQSGVIEWAPSLAWREIPIKQLLEDKFQITTLVENDVNLAVLGEYWKGFGKAEKKNIVFVSVGTGIGAGIVLNGELYRGSTNAAGEVAYFITDVSVLRDNVGRIGNLESRYGADGLIRSAQLIAMKYPASPLAEMLSNKQDGVHINQIIDLADNGDPVASLVFNDLVDGLTTVICNISVVLDPDLVILGSPIDLRLHHLIPAIHNRIGDALLRPINLMASQLGNDALIIGGAYYALDVLNKFRARIN